MQEYIDNNRKLWDGMVPVHVASDFYDVASFMAGRNALLKVERDEVGDVEGKALLHLQCHFGMDTLSWARLGANVTGIDFSGPAVRKARELARELNIDATFIETDVYKLRDVLQGQFDIVFASYGVICWLPDFRQWMQIAASYVKPGGFFYLIDSHPFSASLDDSDVQPRRIAHPYSSGGVPMVFDDEGSYADRSAALPHTRSYEFNHGIGEIVTAAIDAGLRVEFLHEFPFAAWKRFPDMTKGEDDYYHAPDEGAVPLMFSLKAVKPG